MNISVIVCFRPETGEIVSVIRCSESDMKHQSVQKGCRWISVSPQTAVDTHGFVIKNDQVTPIPEAPSPLYSFDYEKCQWFYDTNKAWESIRRQRDSDLSKTDWRMMPDAPLSQDQKRQWAQYRQRLRDITNQKNPQYIEWPKKPNA